MWIVIMSSLELREVIPLVLGFGNEVFNDLMLLLNLTFKKVRVLIDLFELVKDLLKHGVESVNLLLLDLAEDLLKRNDKELRLDVLEFVKLDFERFGFFAYWRNWDIKQD